MPNLTRDENGQLPSYAWPGGYPLFYLTKDGSTVCPCCANRDVDDNQAPIAVDVHWEGEPLICDDCGKAIESAYGDSEEEEEDRSSAIAAITELSARGIIANYCGMYSVYVDGMFLAFDDPVDALAAYRENEVDQ